MDLIITEDKLRLVKESNLSLDEYFYLWSRYWGNGWTQTFPPRVNREDLKQMGLLAEDGLTAAGRSLIDKIEEHDLANNRFDEFWSLYPPYDGDSNFPSTRTLKANKTKAKSMYTALSKKYGEEIVINTLKQELDFKRAAALAKKPFDSPWRYMKNIVNWMRDFEPADNIVEKTTTNGNRHKLI